MLPPLAERPVREADTKPSLVPTIVIGAVVGAVLFLLKDGLAVFEPSFGRALTGFFWHMLVGSALFAGGWSVLRRQVD